MRALPAVALITLLPVSLNLLAQSTAGLGGISGVVLDASGAVIAGARITVVDDLKGIRRELRTNEAGIFNAPGLVPGDNYEAAAELQGFAPHRLRNVRVQVGSNVNLRIVLQVSSTSQEIDVSAVAPMVDSDKVGVSQVVGQQEIDNLPINGRRVDSFVLLTPGVVPDGSSGLLSFRGVAGGNNFLTDGNDSTEQFYNENAGRTRVPTPISQDAVQEFQVLSSTYSAEFGRALGGVVNTVTRSGSNQVHGTGFWFFRNRSLNAKDRYAPINPPEVRHQFGGSLAGPLSKTGCSFSSTPITNGAGFRCRPVSSALRQSKISSG